MSAAEQKIGIKYDGEKPMMDLIPPLAELKLAQVLTAGAQKYSPDNWRHVDNAHARYLAACRRHINAYQQGEKLDDETGLPHLAHAMCCLAFIVELDELHGPDHTSLQIDISGEGEAWLTPEQKQAIKNAVIKAKQQREEALKDKVCEAFQVPRSQI